MMNLVERLSAVVRRASVLAIAASLGACGGDDPMTNRPLLEMLPAPVVTVPAGLWAVVGSSTAAGAGATEGNGWVDVLSENLIARGASLHNLAKGGTVTYHGLSVQVPAVPGRPMPDPLANVDMALSRKPVVLLVAYPSNDTALGYAASETIYNILSIRQTALRQETPVLVLSSQPRNLSDEKLKMLQEIDQQLAREIGPCFVDVRALIAGADGRIAADYDSGDGVHPNDLGHRLIAARVQAIVDEGRCVRLPNG